MIAYINISEGCLIHNRYKMPTLFQLYVDNRSMMFYRQMIQEDTYKVYKFYFPLTNVIIKEIYGVFLEQPHANIRLSIGFENFTTDMFLKQFSGIYSELITKELMSNL